MLLFCGMLLTRIAACSSGCSTEFLICHAFWTGRGDAPDAAYARCRSELDRGEPQSRLAQAGCVAYCENTASMDALDTDDGDGGGGDGDNDGGGGGGDNVTALHANAYGSPQSLTNICAQFPTRTICEVLLDVPTLCASSADPTGSCPVIFFLHGATGRSAHLSSKSPSYPVLPEVVMHEVVLECMP